MKEHLTNEDKILFPKSKITKKDFVNYYKFISKKMIPLIKDRPISQNRFPNGINNKIFFQKKILDYYPKWFKTIKVSRIDKKPISMALVNDLDHLLYLANQVLEFHIFLSKKKSLNKPDRIVFDLDPGKQSFSKIIKAAKDLKKLLDELDLPSFFMTTGSKGLHVIVPIKEEFDFEYIREFSKKIADILVKRFPKEYTTQMSKSKRGSKIFIDYLRNSFAQTTIAPYSIRAIENAPIATPVEYSELKENLTSQSFNIKNISKRKKEPFKKMDKSKKSIKKAIKKLENF
jgi:bifunctional non-homologous end joining protein LigD